ncbi:hypothetical protein [Erythrobacter sp. HL-111]|uniref:hypothetical protein n=1 Tax=Erythrobacter sp. HL-111 TaxID=1798193 RepID=UPI0006DA0925|nr:hypothetical protein [Erythrobacter sp. HL-111]KPP85096.1 MAG: hypothetical protein HLUCCO15_13610 [Erythrobacteraceae bacterium HL-111]SDS17355.1 hypothetical protein SAMN04515621_1085 [Erythrobacter sp. HL-111]
MTFGEQLRREEQRVLEDPVFRRSPTQAKLLRYLVERALAGGPGPTQYEIAVEALGKREDFDLANDSYPRVQVSRLRNSLDHYYARTQPRDGHRLMIEPGQYELRLAATGADPQQGDKAAAAPPGTAPAPALSQPPAAPADGNAAPALAESTASRRRSGRAFVAALVAVMAIAVAGLLAWRMDEPTQDLPPSALDKPAIVLRTDLTGLDGNGDADRDTALLAVRVTEILLAYSLVSDTVPPAEAQDADYTLTLSFMQEPGSKLEAFVSFTNSAGRTLFNELIEHDPARPERFARQLRLALTHITSPTGALAQDRRAALGDPLASGFACFLTIENRRAAGGEVAQLVDTCIQRHPDSDYVPYFRARRAFAAYQAARRAGEPIRASGPAWRDLQLALDADPYNSFANAIAGKVLLAEGKCEAARSNLRIAFEQGANFPTLRALIDAEAPSCPDDEDEIGLTAEELRAQIASLPAADTMHHFYMLVAALASNDLQSARMLAARPQTPATAGSEMTTIEILHRALGDPAFARANAERLRDGIALNIWGNRAVDLAVANLTRAAESSGAAGGNDRRGQAGSRSASPASRAKT